MTKYGKKILEIVSSSRSHMTAEEIFDALRQTYPTVVLATVYNNLNRLWQDDLIRKVSVEGMPDPGMTAFSAMTIWYADDAANSRTLIWGISLRNWKKRPEFRSCRMT